MLARSGLSSHSAIPVPISAISENHRKLRQPQYTTYTGMITASIAEYAILIHRSMSPCTVRPDRNGMLIHWVAVEAAMDRVQGSADFLAPLLQALAESLDVREIFARISAEARRIVPHDFLMLGLLSEDH